MPETQSNPPLVRFGAFEADLGTGELRRNGVKQKFSGQPFQMLAILLERPGEVVTFVHEWSPNRNNHSVKFPA